MNFPCVQCGHCCRSAGEIPALADCVDADGACRYLQNNRCEIYENRPTICNVEKMFAAHFAAIMDAPTFIRKNLDACLKLATAANDHAAQQKIRAEISGKISS